MNDLEIRDELERATSHLSTPPDLLDRVRAGGRRRQVRRRTVLTAGLAAGLAASGAGVWRVTRGPDGPPIASPLLDDPTRGNLRADAAFLASVRAAWLDHVGGSGRIQGAPHVVWAGRLPTGGSVAVVTQRTATTVVSHFTRDGAEVEQVGYGWIGFIEGGNSIEGGNRVLSMELLLTETDISPAALVGPKRDTLVVLDSGRRLEISDDFSYTRDGKVSRRFKPLDFAADGAAVVRLAPQTDRVRFALRSVAPGADGGLGVGLANLSALAESFRTTRTAQGSIERTLTGWQAAWPTQAVPPGPDRGQWDVTNLAGYDDPYGYEFTLGDGGWYIRGATPDRRRLVVQTLVSDDRRDRLFLIMDKPEFLGYADPKAALPIHVRLPDGQGIVIAAAGAELCYRVKTGAWLPVGPDAALVPASATQAQVTRTGGRSKVVDLG